MQHKIRPETKLSILGILEWPANWLRRFCWRYFKVNRYEAEGLRVIKHSGLFSSLAINASEIKKWSVENEMVFDVVHIWLQNGQKLTWIDEYNDLLSALRTAAASKETLV